jgi:uncharacterized Zn finger protein (UPF0148 family)
MSRNCEQCGGRLETFEGESFCPECTYYEAVAALDLATDEALAVLAQDQSEPAVMDWGGEDLLF